MLRRSLSLYALRCPICVRHAHLSPLPPPLENPGGRADTSSSSSSSLARAAATALPRDVISTSLVSFQRHLRTHHPLALGLLKPGTASRGRSASRSARRTLLSSLTVPSLPSSSSSSSQQSPSSSSLSFPSSWTLQNSRSFRVAMTTMQTKKDPCHVPPRRWHPTTAASGDGMYLIAAHLAAGVQRRTEQGQGDAILPRRVQYHDIVFVDFANVVANGQDIFQTLESLDPGAEHFLESSRTSIVIVHEPRASLASLSKSAFARNVARACRLVCIFCAKNAKEIGDVTMADLCVRIVHAVSARASNSNSYCEMVLRFHIVSNDLRHRRALRDILNTQQQMQEQPQHGTVVKVQCVGHHAFGQCEEEWRLALTQLLRMLPHP